MCEAVAQAHPLRVTVTGMQAPARHFFNPLLSWTLRR